MKRIFLSAVITGCCILIANSSFSQTEKKNIQKNEEIIIRKDGNDKGKTIIEIDSNVVTVDGKPLADYNGDVKIITRKFMNGRSDNPLFSPGMDFRMDRMGKPRTFLGVLTEKSDKGVLIKSVTKGSSAEKGGLRDNDIITKLGDKTITSPDDLAKTVRSYQPGEKVTIAFIRAGKKKDLKLALGKTNENPMAFNFDIDSMHFNGKDLNNMMRRMPEMENLSHRYFQYFDGNQPKLGLKIQDTEEGNGAKILNVEEGSAAEKAGLKKDDLITGINGEKVNNVNDVRSQIMSSPNKEHFSIKAKRNNADINFDVQVPKKLNSADL